MVFGAWCVREGVYAAIGASYKCIIVTRRLLRLRLEQFSTLKTCHIRCGQQVEVTGRQEGVEDEADMTTRRGSEGTSGKQ